MTFQIPVSVAALFGSRTRAKILGYLADSSTPRTGYAISKSVGVGVSKVYGELKALESAGFLVSGPDANGNRTFLLEDEDLRRFLVKRVRIASADDWFSLEKVAGRRRAFEAARAIPVGLPVSALRARRRPRAGEFRRSPGKDRALDRMNRATHPHRRR